jgi:CheY-like chemotaxis protein
MIRLLVVDDDEINLFLISNLLKKSSHALEAVTFTSPVEALAYINTNIDAGRKLDLILLDINMPEMTGWDILNELRVRGSGKLQDSLIYMLSSSVHSTDSERAAQFPEVSGFISKPVTLEFLSDIFNAITVAKQV